jgi:hypothetical protein
VIVTDVPVAQKRFRWLLAPALGLGALLAAPVSVNAGGFIFAGETNGLNIVTHPMGYTGTGGTLPVSVCIDPTSATAADMEIPVRNVVNTWNQRAATTGNLLLGSNNSIPPSTVDFESVALHELGHCIGIAHPNLASESGLTGAEANSTKSSNGADNAYDPAAGTDTVYGSSDDLREDDDNLHWYRQTNNNPFTIAETVDSTTYSRDLANLPAGHTFATNADRTVSSLLGVPNTEAVMQQQTFVDEDQRALNHDDVATLRYGMSGLDEIADTADDYSLNLNYAGLTNACDIVFDFDDTETGFAECQPLGTFIGGSGHVRITSAAVFFNPDFAWFFTDTLTLPDEIYVEFSHVGEELGTTLMPFNTLGEGLAAVAPNGTVFIQGGGSSTEMPTVDQNITIEVLDDIPTAIGVP